MKRLLLFAVLATAMIIPAAAQRSTRVRGGVTKTGTYRPPHYRTAPDSSRTNNWSSKPNTNPYTGKAGTVDPYAPKKPRVKRY